MSRGPYEGGVARPLRVVRSGGAGRAGASASMLPAEISSFVGRERELSALKELLAGVRLLTLTGPGGCGKTRLALRAAREVAEEFERGVWWVELASLSGPEMVAQAAAGAAGVREVPGRSLIRLLAERLGEDRALLVLDNCEHLIGACAALSETLLRSCPGLSVLATSREALGVAGETVWLVSPLSVPSRQSAEDPSSLERYEAVRLFAERARATASGFEPIRQNLPAIARVCRRLDGIPLAVELAAARTKMLSVEQIAGRLEEDVFRLLTDGSRTAPSRQRTLRATMDWSYGLLSEDEKVLFHRLATFSGGFILEAAEGVCAGEGLERDEVLDLLSRLVDKSLVVVHQHSGEARYGLLETVRQYARERLAESGEAATVEMGHARFFLRLAEESEPAMLGAGQLEWLERLEREHANLRAALGWLLEERETERGLRFAAAL
ncbi:MAG: AAA family ATPase, partial [Actinomycetota bacterium]